MKPAIVCLTPVRNEAWILERFLNCAATWADYIIIADQGSTDASREIASRHKKVRLVMNSGRTYDEAARQRLLLEEARKIPGPRVLVALDADEALSANYITSNEWQQALRAKAGTVLYLRWANLLPGSRECWLPDHFLPFGFVDDESNHEGNLIHSPRIPTPPGAPEIRIEEVRVLHFQYSDVPRMRSKHRWYQCLEHLRDPAQGPVDIYRTYHHMDALPEDRIRDVPSDWLDAYARRGIDLTAPAAQEEIHWWDREVIDWLLQHGGDHFRKQAIWDVDWSSLARMAGESDVDKRFEDPRGALDRFAHWWLARTQRSQHRLDVRVVRKLLRGVGWDRPSKFTSKP